jgi:hypothetical protein
MTMYTTMVTGHKERTRSGGMEGQLLIERQERMRICRVGVVRIGRRVVVAVQETLDETSKTRLLQVVRDDGDRSLVV